MKAFDLDLYNQLVKEGKTPEIVTRDGRSARIICTDKKGEYHVVAAVLECENVENPRVYMDNGRYSDLDGLEDPCDLFFADLEPTYRPYKDREEVMNAIIHYCGWLREKATGDSCFLQAVRRNKEGILIAEVGVCDVPMENLLQKYTWYMNDEPCGVKEE